jgi:hypothetical protein
MPTIANPPTAGLGDGPLGDAPRTRAANRSSSLRVRLHVVARRAALADELAAGARPSNAIQPQPPRTPPLDAGSLHK